MNRPKIDQQRLEANTARVDLRLLAELPLLMILVDLRWTARDDPRQLMILLDPLEKDNGHHKTATLKSLHRTTPTRREALNQRLEMAQEGIMHTGILISKMVRILDRLQEATQCR